MSCNLCFNSSMRLRAPLRIMKAPSYRFTLLLLTDFILLLLIAIGKGFASFITSSRANNLDAFVSISTTKSQPILWYGDGEESLFAVDFSVHNRVSSKESLILLRATSSDDLKESSKQKRSYTKKSKKNSDALPSSASNRKAGDLEKKLIDNASTSEQALPFDGLGRLSRAIAKATDEVNKREQVNVLQRNALRQLDSMSTLSNKFPRMKTSNKEDHPDTFVSSLTKLTRLLDEKLYTIGPRGLLGDYPPLYGVVQNARDNMISLLNFNQVTAESTSKMQNESDSMTYQVVVVFGKYLVREQITLEYATRIKTLIKMFIDDNSFKPSLICFCGEGGPGNIMSSADAGYFYFRHLCGVHDIDLNGVNFFLESSCNNDDDVILRITEQVKTMYLPKWIMNTPFLENDPTTTTTTTGRFIDRVPQRKKVMIHFTLLSTDYHLCNINDVHHRSPRQSLFRAIEAIDDDMKKSKVYQREVNSFTFRNLGKLIYTSWSYQYATYPYLYAKDDVVVFLGKCFLLGEELMPLLINMKGVVEQKEFFQRDNYLMLASIRRSLVSLLESLHQNPQLEMSLQEQTKNNGDANRKEFKASLEGALLSLGRCVDVVRPAGLLLGSVSISDWAKALRSLEHTMSELRSLCDPDRPLRQTEWFDNIQESFEDSIQLNPDQTD